MKYATRKALYRKVERERTSKVIALFTGDRTGMETVIAQDVINLFVNLLDQIGPTQKISFMLHTNGGDTAAAWRLVNLLRTFCDDLEVIIPLKALSAGTLMSLGADRLVMTKQAVLGPIDPSVNHPLSPGIAGNPLARVPVSVEAVRGYLDEARNELGIKDAALLASILIDLTNKIHPLVLGQIFRSRTQIRYLAQKLIRNQVKDPEKTKQIIDFLCADSGSHDYTMNRREAAELGLSVEKPSAEFYTVIRNIQTSYTAEMKLLEPYSPQVALGINPSISYTETRALVESTGGGSYGFVSEGTLTKSIITGPGGQQETISDQRTFEAWRKIA